MYNYNATNNAYLDLATKQGNNAYQQAAAANGYAVPQQSMEVPIFNTNQGEYYYMSPTANNDITLFSANANDTSSNMQVDENGDQIIYGEQDVRDLFETTGKWETLADAVRDLEAQGYEVDDDAEAKLGIYTEESEKSIALVMEKQHKTRSEAIEWLGDSIKATSTKNSEQLEEAYNYYVIDQGMTHEDAIAQLKEVGYDVDENFRVDNFTFSDEDNEKITKEMNATGCSKKQAIKNLGITPSTSGFKDEFGAREPYPGDGWGLYGFGGEGEGWEATGWGPSNKWVNDRKEYIEQRNSDFEAWLNSEEE